MKHTAKLLALLLVALLAAPAACNDPLRVSIPSIVPPGSLSDTAALGTLRAGAIGDFSIAFSGDHPDGSGGTGEGVIMYGGLLADEWINAETFCSGIPVSHLNPTTGDITYGVPLTTAQLLDTAIVRFNAALAVAGTI